MMIILYINMCFFLQIVCLLFNHIRDLNLVQIFLLMCIISNAYIYFDLICALHLGSSYIAHALSRSVAQ